MLETSLVLDFLLIALGPVGLLAQRRPAVAHVVVYGATLLIAAANFWLAAGALVTAADPETLSLPIGLPWAPSQFRFDLLAAFFLAVVSLLAALAALYGLGYGERTARAARVLVPFPIFIAGLSLVPIADDAFSFLLAWEFMSIASWVLVLSNQEDPAARQAAYVYLVMAAIGTAAMLLGFGLMSDGSGDYGFAAIRARDHGALAANLAFGLIIVGAGGKAGLAPLHAWLPLAHPAAPSHVSALMSGAMTKVALYALIRIGFDLLPQPAWWWGVVLILLGVATAVLGILFAVIAQDLKTMLANSTIKNIGFIVAGLGLAIAFSANGQRILAALALSAALLHVLNHGLYKALLFFGAGAIQHATGTRDLGQMGGLGRRLPWTGALFLIGSAAISALPPLNGFASEWLLFQATLAGAGLPQWLLKFTVPVATTLLALAAALSAAAFVRAYGSAFLGRPRSPEAATAGEHGGPMRWAMVLAACLCIAIGLAPGVVLGPITTLAVMLTGAGPTIGTYGPWSIMPLGSDGVVYDPAILAVSLIGLLLVTWGVVRLFGNATRRRLPPWDCGFPDPQPVTQYGPSSLGMPIRRVYNRTVFKTVPTVDLPAPGDPRPGSFSLPLTDRSWTYLYLGARDLVLRVADAVNDRQRLTIRGHLSLMFTALVLLLSIVAVSQ